VRRRDARSWRLRRRPGGPSGRVGQRHRCFYSIRAAAPGGISPLAARNRLLRPPTDPPRGPAEVDCMNLSRVERSFDDMTRPASGTKVLLYHRDRRTAAFARAPAPVPRRQPATLNPFAGTVRALFGPRQDSQTPLLPIDSTAGRAFRSAPSSARPCGYPAPGSAYLPFAYRSFLGLRSSAINLLPGISTNL